MQPQSTQLPLSLETEEWRPVLEYEGRYEVSDLGRVRTLIPKGRKRTLSAEGVLSPGPATKGYLFVHLRTESGGKPRNHFVHRLVSEAFRGPLAPGQQVNHVKGIKADNRLAKLEATTSGENNVHALRMGLRKPGAPKGIASPNSKLTDDEVREIRGMEGRASQTVLARRFGVSQPVISAVLRREAWRHVSP
jgi:DNA-binding transcriptional regulator YiaG